MELTIPRLLDRSQLQAPNPSLWPKIEHLRQPENCTYVEQTTKRPTEHLRGIHEE